MKKSVEKQKKYSVIFEVALQKASQYEKRINRSLSEAAKERKLSQYKDSSVPNLKKFMQKKNTFIIPKCLEKKEKLKL